MPDKFSSSIRHRPGCDARWRKMQPRYSPEGRPLHQDNSRISHLRQNPSWNNARRVTGSDGFGPYRVTSCFIEQDDHWKCVHSYDRYPGCKAWHTLFSTGGQFFQWPNGRQSFFDTTSGVNWVREYKGAPHSGWRDPNSPCITGVDPPPRWWVDQHGMPADEDQNLLADKLDRELADPICGCGPLNKLPSRVLDAYERSEDIADFYKRIRDIISKEVREEISADFKSRNPRIRSYSDYESEPEGVGQASGSRVSPGEGRPDETACDRNAQKRKRGSRGRHQAEPEIKPEPAESGLEGADPASSSYIPSDEEQPDNITRRPIARSRKRCSERERQAEPEIKLEPMESEAEDASLASVPTSSSHREQSSESIDEDSAQTHKPNSSKKRKAATESESETDVELEPRKSQKSSHQILQDEDHEKAVPSHRRSSKRSRRRQNTDVPSSEADSQTPERTGTPETSDHSCDVTGSENSRAKLPSKMTQSKSRNAPHPERETSCESNAENSEIFKTPKKNPQVDSHSSQSSSRYADASGQVEHTRKRARRESQPNTQEIRESQIEEPPSSSLDDTDPGHTANDRETEACLSLSENTHETLGSEKKRKKKRKSKKEKKKNKSSSRPDGETGQAC